MTKRAYKERFYPTPEQAELLAQSFGCARFVWNNTLHYRTDAYQTHGQSISHSVKDAKTNVMLNGDVIRLEGGIRMQ